MARRPKPPASAASGATPLADAIEPHDLPFGVVHVAKAQAVILIRLALAGIEPAIELDDWTVILSCSRRKVEELKSAGKLPPVDFYVGKCPRWHAATVRTWLERGGE